MLLLINGERLIKDVQREFTNAFPFLKIEFFKNNGIREIHKVTQDPIAHHRKLKDAGRHEVVEGNLNIEDLMSVTDLEKAFMDQFGLVVQVFRKSGNIWLETTMTDSWTLKLQNDHGREITIGKIVDDKDENDYELHREAD